MSPRPNLFIVGAPKCGTTAMTRYLEAHPEVFMAARKDIHFFGSDLGFRNRPRESEADYLARFAEAEGRPVVGESSVWYLYSHEAAREMAAFNPDARILAMLRHPVDTMYALWAQLRLNGLGDEDIADFEEALAAEPDRARGRRVPPHTPLPEALLYHRVVAFSEQLQRYLDAFPREQVRVVLQEDMKADTAGTFRGVLEWLEIDPDFQPDLRRVNTAKAVRSEGLRRVLAATPAGLKGLVPEGLRGSVRRTLRHLNTRHEKRPALDPALRARLVAELEPEVERLEAVLGRDLSAWKS